VFVHYVTIDGTAVAPADYMPGSDVIMFDRGETQKTIRVGVIGNRVRGPQQKWMKIRLDWASANTYWIRREATVYIDDDDQIRHLYGGDLVKWLDKETGGYGRYYLDLNQYDYDPVNDTITFYAVAKYNKGASLLTNYVDSDASLL
jgi:hypothetical protein